MPRVMTEICCCMPRSLARDVEILVTIVPRGHNGQREANHPLGRRPCRNRIGRILPCLHLHAWPRALRVRFDYDRDSKAVAERLAPLVPPGVTAILDQPYDPDNSDVRLDVFHPADNAQARTTVVWVHGGGWLSGSKEFVANYLKILASKGFTVVGVGYSIAPGATYPTPVRQVNTALG